MFSWVYVLVSNNTEQEMTLRKRAELGIIQLVQSVTPLPVETEENLVESKGSNESVNYAAGNMQ